MVVLLVGGAYVAAAGVSQWQLGSGIIECGLSGLPSCAVLRSAEGMRVAACAVRSVVVQCVFSVFLMRSEASATHAATRAAPLPATACIVCMRGVCPDHLQWLVCVAKILGCMQWWCAAVHVSAFKDGAQCLHGSCAPFRVVSLLPAQYHTLITRIHFE